jgi:hypothetical protein
MANPAKRSVSDTTPTGDESASSPASVPSKRVTPPKAKAKAAAAQPARYTAPTTRSGRKPSPRWVPVLMFALWGLGLLVIVLNYMAVLPGSDDGGNGWYLVAGLMSILGGIVAATQYH